MISMNLEELQIHNTHLNGSFFGLDPHLRHLRDQLLLLLIFQPITYDQN